MSPEQQMVKEFHDRFVGDAKTRPQLVEPHVLLLRARLIVEEAAEFLTVSEEHLYDMRRDRRGPSFMQISPKVVRYDREALLAWARSHSIETMP